jgi:hypothetical protein
MPKATKFVKVSTKLEQELLAAVVKGAASPTIVTEKELSKIGRIVHASVIQLCKNGITPPVKLSTVYTDCLSNRGAPKEELQEYLNAIKACYESQDGIVLARIARQKDTLVKLLNEASKQLVSGDVSLRKFSELAEKQQEASEKLVGLGETEDIEPPWGIGIESLPQITRATRGIQGMWIIGGYEGVGKSTFMLQLTIEIQRQLRVLYYDVDGTSEIWTKYRIKQAVGQENWRDASRNIIYRGIIDTLDADLLSVPPPAAIVIDSIQTLPYEVANRRSSVDGWLNSLKKLTQKGYTVLVVSELSREGEYKESSGINYAGALNAVLEDNGEGMLNFIIKKNRHGLSKGHIASLVRDEVRPYWLNEL